MSRSVHWRRMGAVLGVVAVVLVLAGLWAAGVLSLLDLYFGVVVGVVGVGVGSLVCVSVCCLYYWVTYDKRGD